VTGEHGNDHEVTRAGVLEVKTVTPVPNERLEFFETFNRSELSFGPVPPDSTGPAEEAAGEP